MGACCPRTSSRRYIESLPAASYTKGEADDQVWNLQSNMIVPDHDQIQFYYRLLTNVDGKQRPGFQYASCVSGCLDRYVVAERTDGLLGPGDG